MDSKIGLIIQLGGVILIAVLSLTLGRSVKLTALRYWAAAWLSLSLALISLRLAYSFGQFGPLLLSLYYLGEYGLGLLLVWGCRSLDTDSAPVSRTHKAIYASPFLMLAAMMPHVPIDRSIKYGFHCFILSGFFAVAFWVLRRSKLRTFGWRVMNIALIALAVDFFFYSIVFTTGILSSAEWAILSFNSLVDLVLQVALGFGMVIVLLEAIASDSQSANRKLAEAHQKLEKLVNKDPLTAAFNRHAFYGFVRKQGEENSSTSGCVGFFDIDDFKQINDRYGHGVGDFAIRTVVKAIREIIRAEDLIYRWGGDEFFVVMVSMNAEMAGERMAKLHELLSGVQVKGLDEPLNIGVSWGFTDFTDASGLEDAIEKADAEMYRRKQERKSSKRTLGYFPSLRSSQGLTA